MADTAGGRADRHSRRGTRRLPSLNHVLAAAAAGALGVEAYVHLTSASSYASNGGALLNEGNLFSAEAVAAACVAIFLLVSPRTVGWLLSLTIAVTALAAVVVSTYVDVGSIGPIPDLYEPTWRVAGKLPATLAEAFATAVSLSGLLLARRARARP